MIKNTIFRPPHWPIGLVGRCVVSRTANHLSRRDRVQRCEENALSRSAPNEHLAEKPDTDFHRILFFQGIRIEVGYSSSASIRCAVAPPVRLRLHLMHESFEMGAYDAPPASRPGRARDLSAQALK